MDAQSNKKKPSRGKLPLAITVVIVVGALGAFALMSGGGSGGTKSTQPTFHVRKGPLTISVVESGTIQSREQVSLKSEVEGQTTLIFLIPEGTKVTKDDLLIELDASHLQDDLIQQQISVDNAEAAFIRARENLAVARNQAESDISRAELDYQFALEDVKQHVEGRHPQDVKEAESQITLASEELERAAEKLKWSERLYEEKYISQTELEADRLTHHRAELNHELAVTSLQLLQEYTSKRTLAELESNVDQMKMALERVKLQANSDIVQAEASLKASETELRQQRSKLEKTQLQLSKTKIIAPRDGLVVYATSVQGGGRRRSREPLQEGQAIRERQELIYLPSAESMMAQVPIHESSLEKAQIGQTVRLKIDALPDQTYVGRVAKIAPLPDAQSAWLNPDLKVYPTEIHLDGVHPELRTGMSCQAEIIVQQHADALYVPIQAVTRVAGVPTAYVRDGDDFEPRSIEIGFDNNSMVHVLSGLEPGQEVSLTPPLETPGENEPPPAATTRPATPPDAPAPAAAQNRPDEPDRGPEQSEQRRLMRERFQNMTPEEREAFQKRMRERGASGGPGRSREGRRPGGGSPHGGDPE